MMRRALVVPCLLGLALAAASASAAPVKGRPAGPLFVDLPSAASPPGRDAEVVRSRPVRIVLESLAETDSSQPAGVRGRDRVKLNLFSDVEVTAALKAVTPTDIGFAWVGTLEGIPGSHVTLVYGEGVLVGNITRPGAAYRVMYTPAGVHVIEEVDPKAFPPELEPTPVPDSDGELSPMTGQMGSVTAMADSGVRFDVLVVYTTAAKNAAGGTAGIKNLINLGISETNTAYSNSGVIPRLRLVYSGEVSYTESGNLQTDRDRLQNPSDGHMDNVHSLRNTYGADLVKLVVSTSAGGACGIAFLMCGSNPSFESSAFSVTARNCISPNYTFGHELGHNMGSNHAPDDPTGCGAFNYSFGYKDPLDRFRTVMAYDCSPSCPRVLHFSNPSVYYSGAVTGTSTQNNATSINNVRTVVANFRTEVGPLYEGYLDTATCRSINGWAWDQVDPNGSVNVDVFRDGTWVATMPANVYRQDLFDAGKGNGYHAFGYTPDNGWKDGVWHQAATKVSGTAFELTLSPKSIICNVSMFPGLTPAEALATGGTVYTVGTQFSSTHNGYITQIGFHRAPGETGTNRLRLYTDSGTELVSQNATCSSSGWCWVDISDVAITAGTRYRVAVNTNTYQSKTGCGIGGGITNGPLTAHSGYWVAGDTFPTNGSCSNFFVDVKFDI